jgi:hypothetical protein
VDLYYYTLASLPALMFDAPPPIREEEFLAICRATLQPGDYAAVSRLSLGIDPGLTGLAVVDRWKAWLETLRGELARQRAQRLGRDAQKYAHIGGFIAQAQDLARAVLSESSPALAEQTLLRAAWAFLDDLEAGHNFDLERVVLYALKLKIAALKALRNRKDGAEKFSSIYTSIFSQHTTLTVSGERA